LTIEIYLELDLLFFGALLWLVMMKQYFGALHLKVCIAFYSFQDFIGIVGRA
jgi:hypothetical protein